MSEPDLDSTRFDPAAWPVCSGCDTAYVMRRALSLNAGWRWVFMADCRLKTCSQKNPARVEERR